MRVVVTTSGSDGDVNPLLAIAAALVRRGADVTFVANPFYEDRVNRTGSRFVGAGKLTDVFAMLRANPGYLKPGRGALGIWNDILVPFVRDTYPVVRDTIREVGATAVVSHVLSYGSIWAAVEARARNVVVTTTSTAWLSRRHPVVFSERRVPPIVQSGMTLAARLLGTRVLRLALRRVAAASGATAIRDLVPRADLNLGIWPEWFRSTAPDDPPRAHTCGFVFDAVDAALPLSPDVAEFLAAGEPPVVAGFGSAASLHAADRYRALAAACAKLGRRCLLIGPSTDAVAPAPHLMVTRSAPYSQTFPAACAIVHHGGFGTCAEALRSGKPSLVTPFAFDQFDTAARVAEAGLAHRLAGKPEDETAVASALDSLLRDASVATAARAAAARIADAPDGADRAAELIVAA